MRGVIRKRKHNTMVDLVALGEKLHNARRRQGKTLRALQDETGVAFALISRIETGKRPEVTLDVIVRLAQALDVSLDNLVSRNGEEP